MYVILMGYWMTVQVRTMISSLMYKSKFSMGNIILGRVLMITCKMFLRTHLRNTSSIAMIVSVRGRVGSLGDSL